MDDQILENLIQLTGLSEEDFQILREFAPHTNSWSTDIIPKFYDLLFGYAPTAKLFHQQERPIREETLRNWFSELISGDIDRSFWKYQWETGLLHVKRGVRNHMMIAMMSQLQILFLKKCIEEFEWEDAIELFCAFKRITDTITGLIAEGYFEKYLESIESMSGIKKRVIQRMVDLEIPSVLKKHSLPGSTNDKYPEGE
ncbi:MAG: hypothetical protein D6748_16315 [Calditrichaeota bacterium]|nr:MAG: hypothetical protein D6748_16315 [Calditrichota bacterium]